MKFLTSYLFISLLVVAGSFMFFADTDMKEVITSSLLLKLYSAFMAIVCVRMTLFIFDKTIKYSFLEWIENCDNRDRALYYGLRYLGTCILFGFIIG